MIPIKARQHKTEHPRIIKTFFLLEIFLLFDLISSCLFGLLIASLLNSFFSFRTEVLEIDLKKKNIQLRQIILEGIFTFSVND